ncbi:glycerophosphoryl diester phosphodiesterase [mine drainage metagenome]|uniref:Glycerophosphoryl diester phosphodiesterase n=1 Tax=mine drainage metagenome TaxID=410659 RepID=A0A1J5SYV6_9ZZZZ
MSQTGWAGVMFPRVIGHRGAAAMAPENTLASFVTAKNQGAPWVELDVQLSADGVAVVFHDECLDRTSTGRGPLSAQSWAALRRLDAGSWFGPAFAGEPIPTLAEAVATIAGLGLGLNLEIKLPAGATAALAERTARIALAEAAPLWPAHLPPPLVSSFHEAALAEAARRSIWPRGLLLERLPSDWRQCAERLGCVSLHVAASPLTPAQAFAVKEAGLALLAYTVNRPAQAERLWQWGVDGVFTDAPGLLLTLPFAPGA